MPTLSVAGSGRMGNGAWRLPAACAARDNAHFFGMPVLTFRPASLGDRGAPNDLDHIMAMETAGFAAAHRESRAVYARRIETFADGALIVEINKQVVGCFFCEIWHASDNVHADHFRLGHDIGERHDALHGDQLYISSLTLAPDWRGRGLGGQLFAGGIAHVARAHPQLDSALLLVNSTWRHARRIYRDAGFCEIARLAGFFENDGGVFDDGIVMRAPIERTR